MQVDADGGGLRAGTDYFIRKLGGGSYSFYNSVRGAATGDVSDRVDLTGDVTAGVFGSREKIYRIRGVANDPINQKYWEILTPLGIDQVTDLKNLILKTDAPVSLNYVQDLDHDGLPADVEFFLRTSDSPMPTGAVVPGTTDTNEDSVSYGTDPGFSPDPADPSKATGTLVRVTDIGDGGGLTAGTNYYIRFLRNFSYAFYNSKEHATSGIGNPRPGDGHYDLKAPITAGVFATAKPSSTNSVDDSVLFSTDPNFATATVVQVTDSGGGLTAGTDYYIRNLGGGSYSFYDSAEHATAGIGNPTPGGRNQTSPPTSRPASSARPLTAATPMGTGSTTASRHSSAGRSAPRCGPTRCTPPPTAQDSNFDAPKPGVRTATRTASRIGWNTMGRTDSPPPPAGTTRTPTGSAIASRSTRSRPERRDRLRPRPDPARHRRRRDQGRHGDHRLQDHADHRRDTVLGLARTRTTPTRTATPSPTASSGRRPRSHERQ